MVLPTDGVRTEESEEDAAHREFLRIADVTAMISAYTRCECGIDSLYPEAISTRRTRKWSRLRGGTSLKRTQNVGTIRGHYT